MSRKDLKEIASEFGVSPQAVYKRAKQFKLNLSKDIAMNQAAKINQQQIDWSAQLLKINQTANDFLERLIEVVKAADEGEIKEKLKKIEPLLGEKASILEAATRVSGGIRQQLKLLLDGWKQVTDTEQLMELQRTVLNEIGSVSPEVRDRIVERLKAICAIHLGMGLS